MYKIIKSHIYEKMSDKRGIYFRGIFLEICILVNMFIENNKFNSR